MEEDSSEDEGQMADEEYEEIEQEAGSEGVSADMPLD